MSIPRSLLPLLLLVLAAGWPMAATAERRVALVLGNSDYVCDPSKIPSCQSARQLPNVANDAADMRAALIELKFDVTYRTNLNAAATVRLVNEFSRKAEDADVVVVYYAGHGISWRGRNYLVAIDGLLPTAPTSDPADTTGEMIHGNVDIESTLLRRARTQKPGGINIVFLDACRDDPWDPEASGPPRGLTRVRPQGTAVGALGRMEMQQTYIAYATMPGRQAADGSGINSPFTGALLRHIRTPGQNIHDMMAKVTAAVEAETSNTQHPTFTGSMSRSFSFNPLAASVPPVAPRPKQDAGVALATGRCDRRFADALSATPGEALRILNDFIEDCAGHPEIARAMQMRKDLGEVHADEEACRRALAADTIPAYRSYLAMHRQGSCRAQVERRIADLEAKAALPPVASLPSPPRRVEPQPAPPPARGFVCEQSAAVSWLRTKGALPPGQPDPLAYDSRVQWIGGRERVASTKSRDQVVLEASDFSAHFRSHQYTVRSAATRDFQSSCEVKVRLDFVRHRHSGACEAGTREVTYTIAGGGEEPRIIRQRVDIIATDRRC